MLTHFKVSNYKCLVGVELPLTPIHVIIGQNDSGKTSLLEAMLSHARTAEINLPAAFSGEWRGRDLVNESCGDPSITFDATYESGASPEHAIFKHHLQVDFHPSERSCFSGGEWIESADKRLDSNSRDARSSILNRVGAEPGLRGILDSVAAQMAPAALYRLDPKWMATPAAIDPIRKFRMDADGFGLSTLIDDISGFDPERYLALRADFCKFFPQFRSVWIETERALRRSLDESGVTANASPETGKGISFETVRGATIRAQQASDGAILFLGLLALSYTPRPPKLLLIEEPEKGVYPSRLEELVGLIRRFQAERPTGTVPQIVMTTHSPYLLSFFRPEEVTFLSRRDKTGPVRARPLRDAPHIHDRLAGGAFYLGELWYNLSEEELFGDA